MRIILLLTGIAFFCCTAGCKTAAKQQDSELKLAGLQQPVEVIRDKWGVNHIYAANQQDLFFAQGYCAARDRLFQFELWRRQATGTVAEILGERALQRDIGARLFKFRGDLDKEFNHYHPQGKEIITSFTNGVNAYIDEVLKDPAQLPAEFRLLNILPAKWTPDVVISRHQGILGNITEELNIGRAVTAVGEKKIKELLWFHPGDPVLKMDTAIKRASLSQDILALYTAFRQDISFKAPDIIGTARVEPADTTITSIAYQYSQPFAEVTEGSNNWTISGSKTISGYPLLASDPHRKMAIPSLRYIVHLNAPGWNVTGAGEPQIPGIAIGHNENGAWGITVHQTDAEDLYVYDLNPDNLDQYRYKDGWVTMKQIEDSIVIKGSPTVKVMLRYTQHGPVTFIDTEHHKAYAVRAGWLEQGAAPYLSSLRMNQATDWESFREACSYSHIPALNMIWADKKGTIGWQVVGIIPVRKNFSGLVPVPGDGRYEWDGFLPIRERPHTTNPAKGFFATANENLIPNGFKYPEASGFMWPDAWRAQRINEVLSKEEKIGIDKMKALQTDYVSTPAKQLVPLLKELKMKNAVAEKARQLLLQWNHTMDKSSVAAGIYFKWEFEMGMEANKRFVPEAISGYIALQTTKWMGWLQKPDAKFGNDPKQGRDAFLQQTFEKAIGQLIATLGTDMAGWQLGQEKYKHMQFIHPLSGVVNETWKQKLNTISLPRGGYAHTVGATGNTDNQSHGASFRYLADPADWDASLIINTPGQSGNPESRWYKQLFETWAADEYFPLYFSRKKIDSVRAEKMLLSPMK